MLTQPAINWIALSFVRKASDIDELRIRIKAASHPAKIIAKIEKPEAVADIEAIVATTDAIMVARGDLGVEMPIERLPMIQKNMVSLCNQYAKPVIVATQMMESMIENPSPTRAETTDVANAVIDGADAVMLSGETAAGKHPALVVEMMKRIVADVEANSPVVYNRDHHPRRDSASWLSDSVCYYAHLTAAELDALTIIGMTVSGYTAFQVSSYRPKADICIFSDRHSVLGMLSLVWGVRGFFYDSFENASTDQTIQDSHDILKKYGIIADGDIVVNTGAMPIESRLRTNMLRVSTVE